MSARFDQCDETCTVDCGHCKGHYVDEYRDALAVPELLAEADRILEGDCGNCGTRRGTIAGHASLLDAITCESTR